MDDADRALLRDLARRILELRMETPAIFFLESVKPLHFVGSQAMHFFAPAITSFVSPALWDRLAALLERREALEELIREIERQLGES